ncbi:copper homeostasis protein [Saliterribacillus persicus]|uniref:Copper homeostasis protein cutC homolog n=2 Tax=Saliterribacillus persicus TaxID=930114 RepID=A0A368YEC8_9BACI|nr:copper homeostasis protein [Saliterribacillus persicus]
MIVEAIVRNKQEALEAEKAGIDRLELVSNIQLDGLTPNVDVTKEVLNTVNIPVQVMIRPHNHGFFYLEDDNDLIKSTVDQMLNIGVRNFVFGALNKNKTIDETLITEILSMDSDIRITFHRAFDYSRDLEESYRILTKYSYGVERILTSGGAETCVDGQEKIKKLMKMSTNVKGPIIMPGSGLDKTNFMSFHQEVRASEYHFGKGVRHNQSYSGNFNQAFIHSVKNVNIFEI